MAVETYSPRRRAEFLLNNAVDGTDYKRAVREVQQLADAETRRVRLAVPSGVTQLFTPELARLRKIRPDVELELVSGARPVNLQKGEADLAIRVGTVTPCEVATRHTAG